MLRPSQGTGKRPHLAPIVTENSRICLKNSENTMPNNAMTWRLSDLIKKNL